MNWAQFKTSVGMRFQVEPMACRLDAQGHELPEENDDWLFQGISSSEVVSIRNLRTDHIAELGKDHIYDFRSNPNLSTGDIKHGFLVLKMQIFMQGNKLWLRPNARPGERVRPYHTPAAQPSRAIIALLEDLARVRIWSGRPSGYNIYAARLIYGKDFGDLLPEPADYFSALLVHDYIEIRSLDDHGNRPDGTPDTTIAIQLAPRGHEELARRQSESPLNADAHDKPVRAS